MELSIENVFTAIGVVFSAAGTLFCVWFGHWLTLRKVSTDAKNLENAYYIELTKQRDVLTNLLKELWAEYTQGKQERYATGYWYNHEFLEALAVEGVKYSIPLWGDHASLRYYFQVSSLTTKKSLQKRDEYTEQLILGNVDYAEVAGEIRAYTGDAIFSLISPLSHCVLALKHRNNFKISSKFEEKRHVEQLCHLAEIPFNSAEWVQIFKRRGINFE